MTDKGDGKRDILYIKALHKHLEVDFCWIYTVWTEEGHVWGEEIDKEVFGREIWK